MAWNLKEEAHLSNGLTSETLAREFFLPSWLAKVLHHRMQGWADQSLDAVRRYLQPSLKDLPDPFSLPDMDRAAERVADAICNGESIAIYGDYDVDGTVGTALLRRFFRMLGIEPIVYQPDRQKEGYGLNMSAVERLAEDGINLLITVDCGISAVKEVARANELGLDVIICDHHEVSETLPEAYAVLDHKRKDNDSAIRSLCGAGMAFYLALGVRSMLRDIDYFSHEGNGKQEPDLRKLLDLVAVATIADMVPLVEENRILVCYGLEKLRKSPTLGLAELCREAGVDPKDASPYHIGFVIGPRINASGRLASANAALELLSTDDPEKAKELASHLDGMNSERMQIQSMVVDEALAQAQRVLEEQGEGLPALVLSADHWHEGVIGIVASRVVEKYARPVVMITFQTHTGLGKGSVRSYGKFDMVEGLSKCAAQLAGFGGHKAAAGLSLPKEKLEAFAGEFARAIEAQAARFREEGMDPFEREVKVDATLETLESLDIETVRAMEKFGPFGIGNGEPVLSVAGYKITGLKVLKERHMKLQLKSETNHAIEGFWAGAVDKADPAVLENNGHPVEIAFCPSINSFMNRNKVELRIKDVRPNSD